jgi:D-alanine transaminase
VLKEVIPQTGLPLEEKDLTTADLSTAEEVFISSTTREVAGVGSISSPLAGQAGWNYQAPGTITQQLEEAFRQYVKAHLKRTAPRHG